MRARLLAVGLLAAAAAVYALVTVPSQRRLSEGADAYRRARDERRLSQVQVARQERAERLWRQAAAVFGAKAGAEDAVRRARTSVIGSLDGAAVSDVRVSVRPGREAVAAEVSVNATGEFEDVLRLAGDVTRSGTGLVLRSVTFARRRPSVSLTVEAVGPAGP